MLIQVMYPDSRYDYVKDFMLENLIESGRIARFRRRDGWAAPGIDPVRSTTPSRPYAGTERRQATSRP